jgi:hypothetical protein
MEEEINNQTKYYEEHLPNEKCVELLKSGLLFEGKLSVDRNDKLKSNLI